MKKILLLVCTLFLFCGYIQSQSIPEEFKHLTWVKKVGAKKYPKGKKIFNVSDFGAIGDGVFLNTHCIQEAIDLCSGSEGGGIVTFTPGKYLTGSIYLKSNVHLYIDEGVVILGSKDLLDYGRIYSRVAGIEMMWPAALINAIEVENIAISGKGIIHGQGKVFWDKYWNMRKEYEAKKLRWIVDYDCERPRTMLVNKSKNVSIEDVTFQQAGFWTIQLLYSSYCTVRNITIQNNIDGHGPSTDGIDIDSSEQILIENCDIDCNDDNFCLKAGRDADGLRVNRPCRYVVIRDCISRAGGGLITCGSETSGGINNILAYNLKAKGTKTGIRLKSAMIRGGVVENIYIGNVEMEKVGQGIDITLNWNPSYSYSELPEEYKQKSMPEHWKRMLEPVPFEKGIPVFKNIYINNVLIKDATTAIVAHGAKESLLDNIQLSNISIKANNAGEISYSKEWKFNNVQLESKNGLPLKISNSINVTP